LRNQPHASPIGEDLGSLRRTVRAARALASELKNPLQAPAARMETWAA